MACCSKFSCLGGHIQGTCKPCSVLVLSCGRVGDPAKELSAEFVTMLRTSIRPLTYTYPMRCASAVPLCPSAGNQNSFVHQEMRKTNLSILLMWGVAGGDRLGVVADVGQTVNSSITYMHLVQDNPDVRSPARMAGTT